MENNLPKSGDVVNEQSSGRIAFDPNSVFKNKDISYFGNTEKLKIQYTEFTKATGKKKWINSLIVVVIFLLIEAVIIANSESARVFVCDFFSIKK